MTKRPFHTKSSTPDFYNPDDVGLRDSPPLTQMRINLKPSPSPPIIFPRVTPSIFAASDAPKGSGRAPLLGDGTLIALMDGGKNPDIARKARVEALASDEEEEEVPPKGTETEAMVDHGVGGSGLDLTVLAADALRAHEDKASKEPSPITSAVNRPDGERLSEAWGKDEQRPDRKALQPPMTVTTNTEDAHTQTSPELSKSEPAGLLPMIRRQSPAATSSPMSSGPSPITLPSISAQLSNLNALDPALVGEQAAYSQSPPAAAPRSRFSVAPSQPSPPRSPGTTFHLPSPGQPPIPYYYEPNPPRGLHSSNGFAYPNMGDYSSNMNETSIPDQPNRTSTAGIDRMSIDGITNPQIGGYKCDFPGCTAQPFQTQYLLNSHANVHSSARPHYCPVKGCPRSEGGKGFKRKNEMNRHGLVHESPGYVCPFCPDREHRYPRPDNLQRHVRVHHLDADKGDPRLREVLAQRPEGPSRGRRRRGAP